jgi:hypothetical protein
MARGSKKMVSDTFIGDMPFPLGSFVVVVAKRECALPVANCARFSWRHCTLPSRECAVAHFEALLGQRGDTVPRIKIGQL